MVRSSDVIFSSTSLLFFSSLHRRMVFNQQKMLEDDGAEAELKARLESEDSAQEHVFNKDNKRELWLNVDVRVGHATSMAVSDQENGDSDVERQMDETTVS
mgnify:CR=1 FL=1